MTTPGSGGNGGGSSEGVGGGVIDDDCTATSGTMLLPASSSAPSAVCSTANSSSALCNSKCSNTSNGLSTCNTTGHKPILHQIVGSIRKRKRPDRFQAQCHRLLDDESTGEGDESDTRDHNAADTCVTLYTKPKGIKLMRKDIHYSNESNDEISTNECNDSIDIDDIITIDDDDEDSSEKRTGDTNISEIVTSYESGQSDQSKFESDFIDDEDQSTYTDSDDDYIPDVYELSSSDDSQIDAVIDLCEIADTCDIYNNKLI